MEATTTSSDADVDTVSTVASSGLAIAVNGGGVFDMSSSLQAWQ